MESPAFNSRKLTHFSHHRDIKHYITYPYNPQANPTEGIMELFGNNLRAAYHRQRNPQTILNNFW